MQADPTDLGYVEINVPGFSVEDFLGEGAFSVVMKATRCGTDSSASDAEQSEEEEPSCVDLLPEGWIEHPVEGDGNCFFHAIAHQLFLIDSQNKEDFTHETLRGLNR